MMMITLIQSKLSLIGVIIVISFAMEVFFKDSFSSSQRHEGVLLYGGFPQIDEAASSKDTKMKKRIVEDYSASLVDVEDFPFVGELLVAECPSECVLS